MLQTWRWNEFYFCFLVFLCWFFFFFTLFPANKVKLSVVHLTSPYILFLRTFCFSVLISASPFYFFHSYFCLFYSYFCLNLLTLISVFFFFNSDFCLFLFYSYFCLIIFCFPTLITTLIFGGGSCVIHELII